MERNHRKRIHAPKTEAKETEKEKKGQRTITGRAREENEYSRTGFPATRSERKQAGPLGRHAGDAESDEQKRKIIHV
jgi:hypothetical protein